MTTLPYVYVVVVCVASIPLYPGLASGESQTDRAPANATAEPLRRRALAELSHTAKARFAEAKSDDEKNAIRSDLKQRLEELFAADMQEREKRAAEIEARLAKLREQYQARQKKKDEIIDLQVKSIELDADGFYLSDTAPGNEWKLTPGEDAAVQMTQPEWRMRLSDFKQIHYSLAALKERGHFGESSDGVLYFFVNRRSPRARERDGAKPFAVLVVESKSGELIAKAEMDSAIGPLQFTEEGIASRESDGSLRLRIPLRSYVDSRDRLRYELRQETVANSPVAQSPLERLKQEQPVVVAELEKLGHFVESPDGKLYAHATTMHPRGPSYVYVVDSQTGAVVAKGQFAYVVGTLQFTEDGSVATRKKDGQLEVLVPVGAVGKKEESYQAAADAQTRIGAAGIQEQFVSEYAALVERFRKVRAAMAETEGLFAQLDATASAEEKEKREQMLSRLNDKHQKELNEAEKILDAKIKLLKLDLKAAKANLAVAESNLAVHENPEVAAATLPAELDKVKAEVDAASVNVEKAATLLDLFESIAKDDP